VLPAREAAPEVHVRLAFFGVGHWHAGMHANAARVSGAEIVAAWDPSPERADAFARAHHCRSVDSIDEALASCPELAVVMGRPATMLELAARFIAEGRAMLVEKPVGTSGEILRPLAEAAQRQGSFAAVAMAHRGSPLLAEVAALRAAGRLGAVSHSHFRLINGPPRRYVDEGCGWVLDSAVGGGGALRNLGVHGIDAFLALAGDQVVRVEHATFGRPLHGTEVEDYALVVLRAGDGSIGLVEAGYTYASMTGGIFEWRVSATNASLSDLGDRLRVATLDDGAERKLPATPVARRYEALMIDTIDRLRTGRSPAVSLHDHWRAMDLIDRCYALRGAGG
jgi:predicted dehydrogenase